MHSPRPASTLGGIRPSLDDPSGLGLDHTPGPAGARLHGGARIHILATPESPVDPKSHHFDPGALARAGLVRRTATGRGQAWFIDVQGHPLVLRHYRRGGLMGRINADRYLWLGLPRTRPARELRVTEALFRRGLPVPRPAAARVCRTGPFYRGDLLTHELPGTRTLAARIRSDELDDAFWSDLGRVLRRFHEAGAHHADLNVRNLLVDPEGDIYLIDWDRGQLGTPDLRRARRSLARLERSLRKEPELAVAAERHWAAVLRSWESAGNA